MKKNATIAITILSYFDFINEMGNHQVLLVNMKMIRIKQTRKLLDIRKILKDSKLGFSIF